MNEAPNLVGLIIALVLLAILFSLLERFAFALPRKSLFRRERTVDLLWWFFTPIVSRTATSIAVFVAIALVAGMGRSPQWFESQPKLLQIVELLIVGDIPSVASHVAGGSFPGLMRSSERCTCHAIVSRNVSASPVSACRAGCSAN